MHIEEAKRENNSLNLDIHGSQEHSTPSQTFSIENEKGFWVCIRLTQLFSNNEASFSNMEEEELEVEKSDTRFSPEFSKSKDLNLDINERILLALPCHYSQKID